MAFSSAVEFIKNFIHRPTEDPSLTDSTNEKRSNNTQTITNIWEQSNQERIASSPTPISNKNIQLTIANNEIQLSKDVLKSYSIKAFDRFSQVWEFDDFWKRANTCDACINFMNALSTHWPNDADVKQMRQKVHQMLVKNFEFFTNTNFNTVWADDLGWWGLLGINAHTFLKIQGDSVLAEKYIQLSNKSCWEKMLSFAYDYKPDSNPIQHGCRNGLADGSEIGVKNTVANALLFLLSTRLYRLYATENRPDKDKFLDLAYKQWVWFSSWFNLKEYEYLKSIDTTSALVQERPIACFPGSTYQDETHPYWNEGWVWSGDQGLLIAALTDIHAIKNDLGAYLKKNHPEMTFDCEAFEKNIRSIIQNIGNGIQKALVGSVDNIIREAPCESSFGPTFGHDYLGGRGILARFLDPINMKSSFGVDLTNNINATVNAIWSTKDITTNQFKPEFTTQENDLAYIKQFSSLWGHSDKVIRWCVTGSDPQMIDGVCQAMGLDFLGAAMKV